MQPNQVWGHALLFIVICLLNGVARSCTYSEMSPVGKNSTVHIARSMELGGGFLTSLWKLSTHPLGKGFGALKYGFVSIDVGLDFPLAASGKNVSLHAASEGMNSQGLTVSCLTFHGAEYYKSAPPGDKRKTVQWIDFATWALGNFEDVDALVAGLHDIVLVDRFAAVLPAFMRFHWAVADAKGRSVVIEVRDGEPVVYENAVGTLTNDPPFDWHLRNLNNYAFLNPVPVWTSSASKRITRSTCVGEVPKPVGHGLNLGGLPGSYSPADRFVRTFFIREFAEKNDGIETDKDAIALATGVLNNVHIVRGTVASKGAIHGDPGFELTQWSVIKSPQKRQILCTSYYILLYSALLYSNLL